MKILYVAPYPPLKSGIADYAYHFKKAMEQNLDIQMDLLDICQNENICSPKKLLALGKQIKSFRDITKYDLVHFEIGIGQNREFYILHFIKKYYPKVKVVVTLHDPPRVLSAPMKFIGLESMPRAVRGIRKSLDLTFGRYWENKMFRNADRIMVLTEEGKRQMQTRLKRDIDYIALLSYKSCNEIRRYGDRVEKILFFGYLGSKKGVDILIKAFAQLLHSDPEYKDIKLYICGGLPEGGRQTKFHGYLRKLPIDLGISKNIVFTGRVPESEKDFHLKSSDILVLPYRKHNTFGGSAALIEGMSHGLPIIVSDVKSFSTEIEDGKTGLLFEDGNVEMLAEKIKLLVDDKQFREQLGNNAKNHVLREHSWEYVANKMGQIYKACLEKDPGCE